MGIIASLSPPTSSVGERIFASQRQHRLLGSRNYRRAYARHQHELVIACENIVGELRGVARRAVSEPARRHRRQALDVVMAFAFGVAVLREQPVQEPLAIVDSVTMVAIDPDRFATRVLGNEIIAADIGTVPPS